MSQERPLWIDFALKIECMTFISVSHSVYSEHPSDQVANSLWLSALAPTLKRVIPFVDNMKCIGIPPHHMCPFLINELFQFYLLLIPPSPYATCSSLLSLPPGTQWIVAMCVSIPPICFFLLIMILHVSTPITPSSCPPPPFPLLSPFHLAWMFSPYVHFFVLI